MSMATVEDVSFSGMNALRTLDLSSNRIANVDFLRHLSLLEDINLSDNILETLPVNIFSNCCSNLKHLSLAVNRLVLIEKSTFEGLSNLESLSLSDNAIQYMLPSSLHPLSRLKILDLSYNPIKRLGTPVLKGVDRSLTRLDLSGTSVNTVTSVLARISSLKQLKNLYLKENHLTSVDLRNICSAPKIEQLEISFNQIERLPIMPVNCNLKTVSVNDNPISDLLAIDTYRSLSLSVNSVQCDCSYMNERLLSAALNITVPGWDIRCAHSGLPITQSSCYDQGMLSAANTSVMNFQFYRRLTHMDVAQLENASAPFVVVVSWNISSPARVINLTLSYKTIQGTEDGKSTVKTIQLKRSIRSQILSLTPQGASDKRFTICLSASFNEPFQRDTFCRDVGIASSPQLRQTFAIGADYVQTRKRLFALAVIVFTLFLVSIIFVFVLFEDHRRQRRMDRHVFYFGASRFCSPLCEMRNHSYCHSYPFSATTGNGADVTPLYQTGNNRFESKYCDIMTGQRITMSQRPDNVTASSLRTHTYQELCCKHFNPPFSCQLTLPNECRLSTKCLPVQP